MVVGSPVALDRYITITKPVMHRVYTKHIHIYESYGTVSSVVGKRYVQYPIEFMYYFRKQKKAIDKVNLYFLF